MKKLNKKGFTLVELLVVIAVLGIMAGIGLNSMSGITDIFRQRADEKTCDQIARVIEVRIMANDMTFGNLTALGGTVDNMQYTRNQVPELGTISQVTGNPFFCTIDCTEGTVEFGSVENGSKTFDRYKVHINLTPVQ